MKGIDRGRIQTLQEYKTLICRASLVHQMLFNINLGHKLRCLADDYIIYL